jgi:hypothetical protein
MRCIREGSQRRSTYDDDPLRDLFGDLIRLRSIDSCRMFPMSRHSALGVLFGLSTLSIYAQGIYQDPNCYAMSAVVEDGHALIADGRGPYTEGVDEARVQSRGAMSIWSWRYTDSLSNRPDLKARAPKIRSLKYDFDHPVAGSGSAQLGVISDQVGRFHAFWKRDTENRSIASFILTPVGETVTTDRVEMWVMVNGKQHVLQMGPWAMGEFSARSAVSGTGTTRATIRRESRTDWIISAPRGSIARLNEYDDIQHPIDRGLFYFDFSIRVNRIEGTCADIR